MKLTATQRTFISDQLGVKARPKKPPEERNPTEVEDDAITQGLDDYLAREAAVLKSLAALEQAPGTEKLMAGFENEVGQIQTRVRAALRVGGQDVLKTAYADLASIKTRAEKEADTSEKNPTFFVAHAAAEAALAKLEQHPQRAHVQTRITEGRTALAQAVTANDEKRFPDSLAKLQAAKAAADSAQAAADKFNAYRVARAPVEAILALSTDLAPSAMNALKAKLAQADVDASFANGKYAEATAAVGKIKADRGKALGDAMTGVIQAMADHVGTLPQAAFVVKEHTALLGLVAAVPGAVAAEQWNNLQMLKVRGWSIEQAGVDKSTRRQAYLDARKKATDAIAVLAPNAALAKQVADLGTVLTGSADPLATADADRFEEAIALCEKVVKDCAALGTTAAASKQFADEKAALDKRLEALRKSPAAARMGDALASLAGIEAEAGKRTAPAVQDWAGGLELLARLTLDLAAAEALAASLAGSLAAQDAARTAARPEDITKAVEHVRADAQKLDVEPFKALLAPEIAGIGKDCELALAKAKAGNLDEARKALADAAGLLAKGMAAKAQQANFDAGLGLVVMRQQALALVAKTGSYTAVEPRVAPIAPLLEQARSAAKTPDWPAAMVALARAAEAAGVADAAVAGIKAYDDRAKALAKLYDDQKKLGDAVAGADKPLADAKAAAAGLHFDVAAKQQSAAQAKLDALKMTRLAKANPNDADIATTAEALLKLDGGDKVLDDFVATLSGETSFDLVAKLAEKRFGIKLTSDAGKKTLSAQAIWSAMASVPASHGTKNPSLKTVQRIGPEAGSGGSFNKYDKLMKINGRPDDGGTENFDKATRNKALGLPLDHDNSKDPYAPKDDKPANLFNMTVLHEVGHAVDDRLGFMDKQAGVAAYGGWRHHTDLGVIADAVAAGKKYDRTYVLQLLNGAKPDAAVMPDTYADGQDKWDKARLAVDAWHAIATGQNLWYDYGKSKAAAIGDVVYQEAYAGRWVSYLLPERTKGVTAYQWRAPGEWFAEVYMCWFGGKLKPDHPFAHWLEKL